MDDFPCLVHPQNIVTRYPQNLMNVFSYGDDCNALWAIVA